MSPNRKISDQAQQRFWSRVNRPDQHSCWITSWTPSQSHGRVVIHGRIWLTHRLAVWLTRPQDRARLDRGDPVLHQCHNSRCCNPLHLVVGTQWQNIRERDLHWGYRPRLD